MQINIFDEIRQNSFTEMESVLKIYTDGACLGNPGKGGFAWIIIRGDIHYYHSESFDHTTNNRMELMAVISALTFFDKNKKTDTKYKIILYSDSQYVVDAITKGWLNSWVKNNWKKSNREPVKNQDLWETLYKLLAKYDVEFNWIRGHNNDYFNEKCDEMANNAAQNQSPPYHEVITQTSSNNSEKPKAKTSKNKKENSKLELKLNKTTRTLTISQSSENPNELPHKIVINKENFEEIFDHILKLKEILGK